MGKRSSKWLALLLLELSCLRASSDDIPKSSFHNSTIHDVLLRDGLDNLNSRKETRRRRRLHSHTTRSSRGSYTMDSASRRFHTSTSIDLAIPTTGAPGTLWRHTLLDKVFRHTSGEVTLQSKTNVLNSGYHNSFDSFVMLFRQVPLPDGRDNVFGYSYSSSSSSRRSGKGKGKGAYYYKGKGKSSLSKSSKKLSKRSIDAFIYRHAPVQVYDFYPIRPVYYVFPGRPPLSTPLTPAPTEASNPTARPSMLPSSVQEEPSARPTASPSKTPTVPPSQIPSTAPSQTPSMVSTCQWAVCGDPTSGGCSATGSTLEQSTDVRIGGDPEGQEIAVRCCSDKELPNFTQRGNDGSCPYADTEVNDECYRSVIYNDAVRLCTSIEARLCTKDELERRCTAGTGCGHNAFPVWSSTSGAPGYFDAGENSFKVVTPSQDDTEIQETFPCREGITTDIGILVFDEDTCTAECNYFIPYAEFQNYCAENLQGTFAFTIPGPFAADTQVYIGNAAESSTLECKEQVSIVVGTTSYYPVGTNQKCHLGPERLFKIDNVADVDECYNACLTTTDCVMFSVGVINGEQNCMGCRSADALEEQEGFTAYQYRTEG